MPHAEPDFEEFAARYGRRLQQALVPVGGVDAAHDATTDTLVYAWQHWDRVRMLDNPEGYLYVMARRRVSRVRPPRTALLPVPDRSELPEVEPQLIEALNQLSEMQRQVVYLVEGFGWGLTDVGRILGISVSTVRNHLARGLERLRSELKVGTGTDA